MPKRHRNQLAVGSQWPNWNNLNNKIKWYCITTPSIPNHVYSYCGLKEVEHNSHSLAVRCVTSFQRIQYGKGEGKRVTLQWEP